MLLHLIVALLQVPAAPVAPRADSAYVRRSVVRDNTARARRKQKKEPKRIVLTDALRASAFRDSSAWSLLLLAREARTRQDSALQGYDATTYQRASAGLGFTKFGRERLAFRSEQATRVRWRRGIGAYVDVTGSRSVIPIAGRSGSVSMDSDISPVPYYPGSETLWIGSSAARQAVDENEGIVHPLAEGSEAYYVFETGDSAGFRLPDGKSIRLRELKVRPRMPKWNLAVGSLWFDLAGGQLVRAAYRMSVPMDIVQVAKADDSTKFDDVPALVKPLIFPMTAQVSAIGVEYGLYQGRFWLPRLQVMEGSANVSVMRMPFKLEQKFTYANVNSGATLAPIPPADSTSGRSGISVGVGTSSSKADASGAEPGRSARRRARRQAMCDSSGSRSYTRRPDNSPNLVLVSIPCDSAQLANSPDLPGSIYDNGDQTVDASEIDALVQQALSMGAQADFSPQPPVIEFDRPRYNRVEGLSFGGHLDQTLGMGYSAHATARMGVADREPNVELTGSRSDLRRTLSVTAYNRLVAANDWGNPLSFGSSLRAFLFGRDDGYYYRASGVELGSSPDVVRGGALSWSLFAEQERSARQKTTFSLARGATGGQFQPNIESARGMYVGARTRFIGTMGMDPQAFRLLSEVRLEGARGDTGSFGRIAVDLTASHGIGNGAAALTVAGGTTTGTVPLQRYWFLGGSQTVRGQAPGTVQGEAFWMARGEIAHGVGVVRPVVFGDVGWAGSRESLAKGTGLAGTGVGMTVLDGLIRFDVAKGLYPQRGVRVDAYLEARF